jgi:hypothetical protein
VFTSVLTSGLPGLGSPFPTELGIFLSASIIVVVALILGSGRGGSDPEQVAPFARYVAAITVLTFFVALFAAFSSAFALSDLVVDHSERSAQFRRALNSDDFYTEATQISLPVGETEFDFSAERDNDANFSAAVASGLVALTAGGVWVFHLRLRRRLNADTPGVRSIERVARLGVCFVTALTLAIALTSVGFGIFEIAAPGIAIGGDTGVGRAEGVSEVISFGLLAIGALVAFRASWRRVRPRPAEAQIEVAPT